MELNKVQKKGDVCSKYIHLFLVNGFNYTEDLYDLR